MYKTGLSIVQKIKRGIEETTVLRFDLGECVDLKLVFKFFTEYVSLHLNGMSKFPDGFD